MRDLRAAIKAAAGQPGAPDMTAIHARAKSVAARRQRYAVAIGVISVVAVAGTAATVSRDAVDSLAPIATRSEPSQSPGPAEPSVPASPEVTDEPGLGPSGVSASRSVLVFLSETRSEDCAAVRPVERQVRDTGAIGTAALRELFNGRVTSAEEDAGLSSSYNEMTAELLRSLRIDNGVAYVNLDGSRREAISFASTSCGSAAFNATVAGTLRQFSTVQEVRYAFDGDPRDFVEWSQGACPEEPVPPGDRCDPQPWQ